MADTLRQEIKLFYCYAREDKLLRDELEKHLAWLKRRYQLTNWHDREILPGEEWEDTVHKEPCLLYWGHDARRRNQRAERATKRGPGTAQCSGGRKSGATRAVGSSPQADRGIRKAENVPASLRESHCGQGEGTEAAQEAQ